MIVIPAELGGWFKMEAVRPDGTRRLLADWFPNLILNQGLDQLGGSSGTLNACQVGTNSTAPAVGQTALLGYLAGTANTVGTTGGAQASPPYYGWGRTVYRFAQGAAAGNLSEVGVGQTAATGALFSRALILDGDGDPTTITVLPDEFLDVTYELRQYAPTADVTGTITISGVDYDYTLRAALVTEASAWANVGGAFSFGSGNNAYSGPLGAVTSAPAGVAGGGSPDGALSAYTPGAYARNAKLTWSIGAGNAVGGVGAAVVATTRGTFQIGFSPVIPKDNTKILELTFRIAWARKTL